MSAGRPWGAALVAAGLAGAALSLAFLFHLGVAAVAVATLATVPTIYLAWKALPTTAKKPPRGRPAQQWNPVELGVHPVIRGGPMPPYVCRPHDELLRAVLDPAVAASRLVVVRGGSSTGKTRAAYEAAAAHGEDLPAPGRPAFLASGRRAGDLQPHQKRPGAGGHLRDHCPRADRSRAGPPGDDLIAVAAVGIAGTLRRAPAGTGIEQIPDGIKIAGLQGGPDPPGERGRLFRGTGIVWHEDLRLRCKAGRSSLDATDTRAGQPGAACAPTRDRRS